MPIKIIICSLTLFIVFIGSAHADFTQVDLHKMIMDKHPENSQEYKSYKQQVLTEHALADQKRKDEEFQKSLPAIKAKEKAMMDAEAKAEEARHLKQKPAVKTVKKSWLNKITKPNDAKKTADDKYSKLPK